MVIYGHSCLKAEQKTESPRKIGFSIFSVSISVNYRAIIRPTVQVFLISGPQPSSKNLPGL